MTAHNLTATGVPTFATGKFGQAFSNPSSTVYYRTTDDLSSTTGTIEAWAYFTAVTGTFQIVCGNDSSQIWIGLNNSGVPQAGIGTNSLVSVHGAITLNAWHHLALCVTGNTAAFYVDGVGAVATATTLPMSLVGFSVGAYGTLTGYPVSGMIDEVRVSNTFRWNADFTPQTAAYVGDANTVALYHLDGDGTDQAAVSAALTNTTAPAISGNTVTGSVLTVSNGSWSATPDSYSYQWNRAGAAISGATAATYTLTSADVGQAITATVTAVKAGYTSGTATSASVTPSATTTVPGQVAGLTATAGNAQVSLSWTAPGNGGSAITDYLVEYQPSGGSWTTFADGTSTATSATVTGLTNGTAYAFRVSAINSVGTGTASATATATPSATTPGTIAPNDGNIVYSPYNWVVSGASARTNCSGAYLRTTFAGSATSIVAHFDMSASGGTYYAVSVDGGAPTTGVLAASVTVPIPSNGWAEHVVEIVLYDMFGTSNKWTVPQAVFATFTGFTVAPTTVTTTTCRRRPYNVLCFGDSILEGYDVTSQANGAVDARYGWGFPLRDLLGAEVGIVGMSAQGYTKGGMGVAATFAQSYNQQWDAQPRSFTTPTEPNIIVINMGTNDNGADITAAFTAVLNGLLAATTNTKILIVQQWNGTLYKATMQGVIASCTAPGRVTYLDTSGWLASADTVDGTHPWGYVNISDLAPRLASVIQPLLAGASSFTPKRFINVGGAAKAIG